MPLQGRKSGLLSFALASHGLWYLESDEICAQPLIVQTHHLLPCVAQIMVDCLGTMEGTVVGVVGLGHLDGMERLWKQQKGG